MKKFKTRQEGIAAAKKAEMDGDLAKANAILTQVANQFAVEVDLAEVKEDDETDPSKGDTNGDDPGTSGTGSEESPEEE